MQEKFRLVFLFFIFSFLTLFADEKIKNITFVTDFISEKNITSVKHLIDIAIIRINEKNKNIIIKENDETFDSENSVKIQNFLAVNSLDAFYHITVADNSDKTEMSIKVFSFSKTLIYQDIFSFAKNEIVDNELYFKDELINKWLGIIDFSIEQIKLSKEKFFTKKMIRNKTDFTRDFPLFNLTVSAVSAKLYTDEKFTIFPYKIFSFFPFDFRATFYPLKYLETGLFLNLNYDNLVIKYYDDKDKENKFFDIGFVMQYGLFIGASFFNEDKFHYSVGLQISNMLYDLSKEPEWFKTNNYESWFLPQFALYQKADFKLFKFLYFSLLVSLKTMPMFYLKDNYFSSKPFHYDLFYVEISIIGLSIVF